MTAQGEDLLATHHSAIAEAALRRISAAFEQGAPAEEIHDLAVLAITSIDMRRRSRPSFGRGRAWLAKVTSNAFPRCFTQQWDKPAVNHLCFTAEIVEGSKAVAGREVEVQLPDADAERLAHQILRLVQCRKQTYPGLKGDRMT
jgi:hypothetical protein